MRAKSLALAGLVLLFLLVAFLATGLPTADFYVNFYSAARAVLGGRSPYDAPAFSSAPWGIIPFIPFAVLPAMMAHGAYFAFCMFVLAYMARHLKASPLAISALFLSPTAIATLLVGNLDSIVVTGMLLVPAAGLLLLLIKPQIGAGVALYYLIDLIRAKRFLGAVKAFFPVVVAFALAFVLFPIWYNRMLSLPGNPWNRSLFPYSIPLGLLLLWLALRNRNPYFALASTPFFAPYLTFPTYLVVQIGLLHADVEKVIRRDVLQILLCVLLWVLLLTFKL
jgi:hypothetical protein